MPNSGTVSAGSVALASQYNNLRDDVLSNTTGHVHDGTTDGGKQIEGTVIKSTGAVSGYVLTAGAGGTTTTWAAPAVGGVSTITGTATWSGMTPTSTFYTAGAVHSWSVTGGGTVIISILQTANTSARTLYTWNLANTAGTIARQGTATPALITAGTVTHARNAGKGLNGGDGYVFLEGISATTSGSVSSTLRRFTNNLATNSWNTTIYSAAAVATTNWNTYTPAAFAGHMPQWISEANMWLGWDRRNSSGTSNIYAVNDTTGTLYTAAWGTYVSSNDYPSQIYWVAYVPADGAGNGTVHAFTQRVTSATTQEYRRISYSLGTAAITAVSTATNSYGFPPLTLNHDSSGPGEKPLAGWWDAAATAYVFQTLDQQQDVYYYVGVDRTMSTVLWRSRTTQQNVANASSNIQNTRYDPVTKFHVQNGNGNIGLWRVGDPGALYAGRRPSLWMSSPSFSGESDGVAGAGSVTHMINVTTNGSSIYTVPIAQLYSTVTLPAASVARILIADDNPNGFERPITTIAAGSSFPMNSIFGDLHNTTTSTDDVFKSSFPLIIPANQSVTLFVTNFVSPLGGAVDFSTWYQSATAGTAWVAGTSLYTFRAIALA